MKRGPRSIAADNGHLYICGHDMMQVTRMSLEEQDIKPFLCCSQTLPLGSHLLTHVSQVAPFSGNFQGNQQGHLALVVLHTSSITIHAIRHVTRSVSLPML